MIGCPIPSTIPRAMPSTMARTLLVITVAGALLATCSAYGDHGIPASTELWTLARQLRPQLQPPASEDLNHLRNSLQRRVAELDHFLGTLGDQQEGWRSFLKSADLASELQKPEPDVALLRQAARYHAGAEPILTRYGGYRPLSPALNDYAAQLSLARTTAEDYDHQLQTLTTSLEGIDHGDPQSIRCLAEFAGWLEMRALGNELREAVDRFARRPNVHLTVSHELADTAVRQSQSTQMQVDESILGTRYVGTSTTDWTVSTRLHSSEDQLAIQFLYTAAMSSRTKGYNGSMVIGSRGTTVVTGTKEVRLGHLGWSLQPATADATACSQIVSISDRRLLGRRLAKREAYRQKPATEREVACLAEQRTCLELDRLIDKMVRDTSDRFVRQLRIPLTTYGQFPGKVELSTNEGVEVAFLQANGQQLGATTPPPEPLRAGGDSDLYVCLHTSAINNLSAGMLAGRTMTETQLADEFKNLWGSTPAALTSQVSDDAWTIQFEQDQPITVNVDTRQLTLQIRAEQLAVGERVIPGSWITATYELRIEDGGLRGRRKSPLQIVPAGYDLADTPRLGVRYQVFRSMLRQRFERVMPDEFFWNAINLPAHWPQPGRLRFQSITAQDDWLMLAWQLEKR